MSAVDLLGMLEGVRQSGSDRWTARCPAHEDKSPSLSVRDTGDRWLVHCFSGCEPLAVVQAIGLEWRDLYHDRRIRGAWVQQEHRLSPRDALDALAHEVAVVAYVAADMIEHKTIDDETWQRLAQAHRRISDARALMTSSRLPS